jgi:hypothetical protein
MKARVLAGLLVYIVGLYPFGAPAANVNCAVEVVVSFEWGRRQADLIRLDSDHLTDGTSMPPSADDVNQPRAVVVDGAGNILVGDSVNYRILRFTDKGKLTGKYELQPTEVKEPLLGFVISALGVDREDNIYVKNETSNRIEVYTKQGYFVRMFNVQGGYTSSIFVDRRGNIFTFYGDRLDAVYSPIGAKLPIVPVFSNSEWRKKNLVGYSGYSVRMLSGRIQDGTWGWHVSLLRGETEIRSCHLSGSYVSPESFSFYVDREGAAYFFLAEKDLVKLNFFPSGAAGAGSSPK